MASEETPPVGGDASAQPDEKMALLRSLLETGQFSDFVLVSHGKRFSLHKAIVHAQSPVIAAAFGSQFKEATTGEIVVDNCYTLETVERMVEFLYTGSYEITIAVSEDDVAEPSNSDADMEAALKHANQGPVAETYLYFQANLALHNIAHYYDISSLEKLQVKKMEELLCRLTWTPQSFALATVQALETKNVDELTPALVRAGLRRLSDMSKAGVMPLLEAHPSFLVSLLQASGHALGRTRQKCKSAQNKSESIQADLASLRRCVDRANRRIPCQACESELSKIDLEVDQATGAIKYTVKCAPCSLAQTAW